MKYVARRLFQFIARLIIRRYQPLVVGVAGSVGKTSAKDAIAIAVQEQQRTVRKTVGSFNAEVGVPVTIIAGGTARRTVVGWLSVLSQGLKLLLTRQPYPSVLVLEMGSDKPGDLAQLLKVVQPQVGVLTSTAPEHLEFFGDEASVIAEESLIVRTLPPSSTAVINIDDDRNRALRAQLVAKIITYGWHQEADVRAESVRVSTDEFGRPTGMIFKVAVGGSVIPVALPGVLGRHQVLPLLAAIAVGRATGGTVAHIMPRLSGYKPPAGRMRLLDGREGSVLVDDSYNSSPEAVKAALETVFSLTIPGKKYIVLGQMSELGASADSWHDQIGHMIGPKDAARLITVGPLAKRFGEAAKSVGFPAIHISHVETAEAAATELLPLLSAGDVVLLKGSRYAARLERAAKILLANPDRDRRELVGEGAGS